MTIKIGINGLGRIGRCVIRALCEYNVSDIEIVAANSSQSAESYVNLLKYDSLHGRFPGDINAKDGEIYIGKHIIKMINERDPVNIPWGKLGVDVVIECTGKFTAHKDASKHIQAGAKKVLISAPSDDADVTIVYGVNNNQLNSNHNIVSVGSCTTNAIAPLAKILNDEIGIKEGYLTTVHAYTNDQNVLDNSHKDPRRARAASLSMIPTSTGAAKAIGKVLPELSGKLSGSAIRVPVPNVSLIDFTFNAEKKVDAEQVNAIVEKAAKGKMLGVIEFAKDKLVSIDFNHTPYSTIFDPYETKVINNMVRILSWYDNEWGYANRMVDVTKLMKKFLK
jgi:glyceraldehyde 3-phosphate dehydrogenase